MANTKISLNLPAVKCFIKQLENCSVNDGNDSGDLPLCIEALNGQKIKIRVVWIQGNVVEVSDDRDQFLMNDGTGTCNVTGFRNLNIECPDIVKGKYMMVVGELRCDSTITILSSKLQDLSENGPDQELWLYEVVDSMSIKYG